MLVWVELYLRGPDKGSTPSELIPALLGVAIDLIYPEPSESAEIYRVVYQSIEIPSRSILTG